MDANEIEERALTARRKTRLEWYETEIDKRGNAWLQIWRDLAADTLKPYLATHPSLDAYATDRWGMTPRRILQLKTADNFRAMLLQETPELAGVVNNMREGPMRELVNLPAPQAAEVIRKATEQPGKVTAKKIKMVKARIIDAETGQPEPEQRSEQMELPFLIIAPPDDIQWFKTLTKEQRGQIITTARQNQAP